MTERIAVAAGLTLTWGAFGCGVFYVGSELGIPPPLLVALFGPLFLFVGPASYAFAVVSGRVYRATGESLTDARVMTRFAALCIAACAAGYGAFLCYLWFHSSWRVFQVVAVIYALGALIVLGIISRELARELKRYTS